MTAAYRQSSRPIIRHSPHAIIGNASHHIAGVPISMVTLAHDASPQPVVVPSV
ncbi:hypothetical protein GCM10029964_074310 [Kibdelosporangium lantanae]